MGRAADNERLKLRATFFNNLSVGLFLGGLLIPYIGIVSKTPMIAERLSAGEGFTRFEVWSGMAYVVSIGLAYYGGRKFRRHADDIISRIED